MQLPERLGARGHPKAGGQGLFVTELAGTPAQEELPVALQDHLGGWAGPWTAWTVPSRILTWRTSSSTRNPQVSSTPPGGLRVEPLLQGQDQQPSR